MAAGAVVARRPDQAIEQRHPMLGQVFAAVSWFSRTSELAGALAKARDPDRRRRLVESIRAAHLLTHRLQTIRARCVGSVAAPTAADPPGACPSTVVG
jgi:hypothetical protein